MLPIYLECVVGAYSAAFYDKNNTALVHTPLSGIDFIETHFAVSRFAATGVN